jgi:hypothetical protein
MGRRRLDLKAASEELGITSEAVRKRAKRGTLESETGPDGKTYVWIDDRVDGRVDAHREELLFERMASEIDHLREQLKEEREANRENRRIIAGLVQRVPELEAPSEPRDGPTEATEGAGKGEVPSLGSPGPERRFWLARASLGWRRFFGF